MKRESAAGCRWGLVAAGALGWATAWGPAVIGGEWTNAAVVAVTVAAPATDREISAALAALPLGGGRVELGAGVFTVTRPIVIDRDDVELRGAGPGTVLVLAAKANCPVLILGSMATPVHRTVSRVAVADLVIDGNRLEQDFECYGGECNERGLAVLRNNGITMRGVEDGRIERVVTRWARSGGVVLEKHCRRIRISELEAHDNEFDGLAAYETEESVFTRLNLHRNLCAGISLDWRFHRNTVADAELRHNGSQGIFMRDSGDNRFERLLIEANGAQGIFLAETPEVPNSAARGNRFVAVTITGNHGHGIRINDAGCTGNALLRSRVSGNGREDISLAGPAVLMVSEAEEFYAVAE